ncbi:MAG: hypothetical protein ACRDYF_06025 [Acidimicrobiia bacterium]
MARGSGDGTLRRNPRPTGSICQPRSRVIRSASTGTRSGPTSLRARSLPGASGSTWTWVSSVATSRSRSVFSSSYWRR